MYVGRFAPSPTGHLHLGSLYIALASYLDAKAHSGKWLIRIDDVDQLRCNANVAENIIQTLGSFGLHSDQGILYQSQREKIYQKKIQMLADANAIFYCVCSRKKLSNYGPIYPGFCRQRNLPPNQQEYSIRLKTVGQTFSFTDLWREHQSMHGETIGDTVIFRKDGFTAYHLATVVDDQLQGVTHIVRGADLLEITPIQMMIQAALGFGPPIYGHLPIVLGKDNKKLSKSNLSDPINNEDQNFDPMRYLHHCQTWLGLSSTPLSACQTPENWLRVAIRHWRRDNVPKVSVFPSDHSI